MSTKATSSGITFPNASVQSTRCTTAVLPQSWHSVSRAIGTTYYNTVVNGTTGTILPICVSVTLSVVNSGTPQFYLVINGVSVNGGGYSGGTVSAAYFTFVGVVPPNGSYYIKNVSGSASIQYWAELY